MATGTMTSKGQITVPKDVREALGLTAGTKVNFTKNADGDYVLTVRRARAADLAGRLKHHGDPIGLDEMEAAVADGARESL